MPSLENKIINATDKTGIRVKYEGCLIFSSKNIIEKNKKNNDSIRIKSLLILTNFLEII